MSAPKDVSGGGLSEVAAPGDHQFDSWQDAARAAGETLAEHLIAMESMTPREAAEAIWSPTSSRTVEEIEDRVRADRGLPPKHAAEAS